MFGTAACGDEASSEQDSVDTSETATLQWWSWNPDTNTVGDYLEGFEAAHPEITVEHRFIQYSDYVNGSRLALQSDDGPDVFGLQVGSMSEQFAPLATDLAPLAVAGIGEDWTDQMLATDQFVVDEKQVAMPWMITGAGTIWTNDAVLAEAGVEAPTTLDEWKVVCEKLAAIDKACLVQGAKDGWQNLDVFQAIANQIDTGAFYDSIGGTKPFDSPR